MKKLLLFQIAFLFSIASYAQNTDCNRAVWIKQDEKKLPKEICIPNGNYHITEIYERVDVNGEKFFVSNNLSGDIEIFQVSNKYILLRNGNRVVRLEKDDK